MSAGLSWSERELVATRENERRLIARLEDALLTLANERQAREQAEQGLTARQYPHWQCRTHGRFDAYREVGCPTCVQEMRTALAAERQAREQAEQERDRLGEALQRIADCDHDGCTCCGPCIAAMFIALSPQDGQR